MFSLNAYVCTYMCGTGTYRGQRRVSDPLQVESQIWGMESGLWGTEPGFCAIATGAPAPSEILKH